MWISILNADTGNFLHSHGHEGPLAHGLFDHFMDAAGARYPRSYPVFQ